MNLNVSESASQMAPQFNTDQEKNSAVQQIPIPARQSFFSNIISKNMNNAQVLFSTVEKLTNPPSQLGPELVSTNKCNEFASFFKGKIDKIRQHLISNANHSKPRTTSNKKRST